MKKNLQFAFVFASLTGSMFAQLPVGTAPQNKTIYLEEFTGIHCGYCPDGHRIGTQIATNNPGNTVLVNIHSGGFANPSGANDIDFRTPEGTAIDQMAGMGITGYPAGNVNRKVLVGSVMAAGRGSWTGMSNTIKSQPAYCNVACEGSLDPQTRVLTVKVEVYYTANSPVATNYINVFLLESKVRDKVPYGQSNYGTPLYNLANYNADGTYNHNHLLRKAITATFGDPINTTTSGNKFTATYNYTIPGTFPLSGKTTVPNFENLELAAFVTETDRDVINAANGPVAMTTDVKAISATIPAIICNSSFAPEVIVENTGATAITNLTLTPSIDGVPQAGTPWTGNIAPGATETITLNSVNVAVGGGHAFSYVITGDFYTQNNTAKANFYTAANYQGTPVAEGFVMGAFPPASWNIVNADAGPSWSRKSGLGLGGYNLSTESAKYDFYTNTVKGDKDELYLPPMDLSGADDPEMFFDIAYVQRNDNSDDALDIYASSNCGDNWTLVYNNHGAAMSTSAADVSAFVPTSANPGVWRTEVANMPGFNKPNVLVKFVVTNDNGNNMYLDNINLRQNSPVGIKAINADLSSVSLYPNPTNGLTSLSINAKQASKAEISVVNQLGQVVAAHTVSLNDGNNSVEIDTKAFAAGIYNVSISTDNGTTVKKLNVIK